MKATYRTRVGGDYCYIRADFSQAADPIRTSSDGKYWTITPYRVADASHSPAKAMAMVIESCGSEFWAGEDYRRSLARYINRKYVRHMVEV